VTAAELYEIVKDVPEAAWPTTIHFDSDEGWKLFDDFNDGGCGVEIAEAAFVGSMVAWLIGEGYHVLGWDSNSDTSTATLVLYDREFSVSTDKYRGMGTIVALLAAACKDSKEARP
jgi:hypothetical protein